MRRLLAIAPDGLQESDLVVLLRRPKEKVLPLAVWARLFAGLRTYCRVLPSGDAKVRAPQRQTFAVRHG